MLHLKSPISIHGLEDIDVVRPPNAGSRWKGVSHHDAASALISALGNRDIKVTDSKYHLSHSGRKATDFARMAGVLHVEFGQKVGLPALTGMQYAVAILNNNDMSKSIRIVCGSTVAICTNGMIMGIEILKRKHTKGVELEKEFDGIVDDIIMKWEGARDFVTKLKGAELDDKKADHILMEAARQKVIPWTHLDSTWNEYKNTSFPTHHDFTENTAWSLYNAATYVAQRRSVDNQAQSIHRLKDIVLDKVA